jgi:hypothetical protein
MGVGVAGADATRVEAESSRSLASMKASRVGVAGSQATNITAPVVTLKTRMRAVFARGEAA